MSRYRTGFYLKHDQLSEDNEDCGFIFLEDEEISGFSSPKLLLKI